MLWITFLRFPITLTIPTYIPPFHCITMILFNSQLVIRNSLDMSWTLYCRSTIIWLRKFHRQQATVEVEPILMDKGAVVQTFYCPPSVCVIVCQKIALELNNRKLSGCKHYIHRCTCGHWLLICQNLGRIQQYEWHIISRRNLSIS